MRGYACVTHRHDFFFQILNGKISWNEAFSTCEEWDGELVTIHSAGEDDHVMCKLMLVKKRSTY